MSFTEDQKKQLAAPLGKSHVKKNPRGYDYVEGWHAIAEANRIFGFDGWHRQTLEMRQLGDPEQVNGNWRVAYHCRVRVTVLAGETEVVRDGSGYGSGIVKDIRDAHESAIKEAETDAMKRALMTFGNPFGLALYDKAQNNVVDDVVDDADQSRIFYVKTTEIAIDKAVDGQELRAWWDGQKQMRREVGITDQELEHLKALLVAKLRAIEPQKKDAA